MNTVPLTPNEIRSVPTRRLAELAALGVERAAAIRVVAAEVGGSPERVAALVRR